MFLWPSSEKVMLLQELMTFGKYARWLTFYYSHWNDLDLQARVNELISHHIERCADILKILGQAPKTAREVAVEYFEESLLKGFGILMAENEIISHCELLSAFQDVVSEKGGRFTATGSANFESAIRAL